MHIGTAKSLCNTSLAHRPTAKAHYSLGNIEASLSPRPINGTFTLSEPKELAQQASTNKG